MNIALISPSKGAYSETFIEAHKKFLAGTIFYYYGAELPSQLEGGLIINSRRKRIIDIIKGHYHLNRFSLEEQALITSFKKNHIDLVFAEYGGTGERILPVCKELGLPLIVHFHGFDASRNDQLKEDNNYKEIFNYASYIVCVSKKMEEDLLKLGCPSQKLVYNVYGPRDEFFKVKPRFEKEQFIAIGRFVDKKAPYYLILSFKEVLKQFPNAKLVIAGEGELWNTCKNLIRYYGLKESIFLSGIISPERYQEYLAESLAFVQHSIIAEDGDSEGTPVALLEASAAGLPVISTRHAGIIDVVMEGKTGLLCEEHDVKAFSNNMKQIIENKEKAQKMGMNGKKYIKENYTLLRHIECLNGLVSKSLHQ